MEWFFHLLSKGKKLVVKLLFVSIPNTASKELAEVWITFPKSILGLLADNSITGGKAVNPKGTPLYRLCFELSLYALIYKMLHLPFFSFEVIIVTNMHFISINLYGKFPK